MKRTLLIGAAALAAMVLIACGGGEGESSYDTGSETASVETASALDPIVEKAVKIGRAVEAEPNRADEILAEHGMTADELEELMIQIAADPEMSSQYDEAMSG